MSDVQIAVIDQQDTQIVLAVPGVQGATGSSIPSGGTTDQVLRKNSSTDYDANWAQVTSAMIANGTIVNDDINNSAAIAGTKISPDFGGQAVTTTGQVSAARVNVTSNTPPSNGIYLPSANNVAISTGGSGRLFINSSGQVGVGTSPSYALHVSGTGTVSSRTFATDATGDASFFVQNDGNGICGPLVYGSTKTAYGALASNETALYSNRSTTIMADGASTVIKFATGGNTERLRITSTGTVNIVGAGSAGSTQAVSFNGSAPVNSLVLTSGGLLGVGTSTPESYKDEAEQLVVARAGNCGITVASATNGVGALYFADGTSGSDASRGGLYYSHIDNSMQLLADGSARVYITSGGLVGIGTSEPAGQLDVSDGTVVNTQSPKVYLCSENGADRVACEIRQGRYNKDVLVVSSNQSLSANLFNAIENGTSRFVITGAGNVGIGTTQLYGILTARAATNCNFHIRTPSDVGSSGEGVAIDSLSDNAGGVRPLVMRATSHVFFGESTERARIDSSGRLLVGTPSARTVGEIVGGATFTHQPNFQLESPNSSLGLSLITNRSADSTGPFITLGKSRGNALGGVTVVQNGDELGNIYFAGADGTDIECIGAAIFAEVDGIPGANDMPGRLVFSTTADGASSPTPRMRITNGGGVRIAQDITDDPGASNITGIGFGPSGFASLSRTQGVSLFVNRTTDDGGLAIFRQDGTDEGSITVSGTTVSYNGAHLSRWSQLPSGAERTEILRGTVLSNINEMCEWGEEDNEQLNRMKVSDVEGDKNVSGVFQAWDDDDDTYTNDFYCAMTGDFIIRIGAGITVERGDLLMSAGDGTAKPQDDDIIRSKTIAKVTSTNVSCTYPDGSYCVPCVLMAC